MPLLFLVQAIPGYGESLVVTSSPPLHFQSQERRNGLEMGGDYNHNPDMKDVFLLLLINGITKRYEEEKLNVEPRK